MVFIVHCNLILYEQQTTKKRYSALELHGLHCWVRKPLYLILVSCWSQIIWPTLQRVGTSPAFRGRICLSSKLLSWTRSHPFLVPIRIWHSEEKQNYSEHGLLSKMIQDVSRHWQLLESTDQYIWSKNNLLQEARSFLGIYFESTSKGRF